MLITAAGVKRVRALYGSPNNLALYLERTFLVTLAVYRHELANFRVSAGPSSLFDSASVGLDIVGDKLLEINVFSPGGLGSDQSFENVNFSVAVIAALEQKVQYMGFYQRNFNNVDMATL